MQTLVAVAQLHQIAAPLSLATGFFDGVHLGHQAVLRAANETARRIGGQAWALTFDQHPLAILQPGRQPPLLSPLPLRLELLAKSGIDGCLLLPFTRELAAMEPQDFIEWLTGPTRTIAAIHCGTNWHFGAYARGNPALLSRLGDQFGFTTTALPALQYRDTPISSTRIRRAIQSGDVAEAACMLGRHYYIRESVVHGRGVGRTIGMATANLHPSAEVLPAIGVYAVQTRIGNHFVPGVASLGWRPTFADARPDAPVLEIHLLDFEGDLYGATLDVAFVARLRDEIKFPDAAALVAQVRDDIRAARTLLSTPVPFTSPL